MVNPKITIIILNFNGLEDTKKCISSLLKSSYKNFEAIVVDNGSKENEVTHLKRIFKDKRIKFLRSQKNLGFSGGNNRVLKEVKTKYVVLLNNDTTVSKNWLQPLIEAMEKDKTIAVVQPKILWMKNKKYFDYAGACGGFIDIFGYPFTRGRIFDTLEEDKGQYDNPCDIFWASGAVMAIRTSIFKKVGYFDELFFNYMEEIDLCFRIHRAGYRIISEPKSFIYHKVAGTAFKNPLKKRFWEHRNNLLLLLKNYPLKQLLFLIPMRILLESISIIYYLYKKRIDFTLAVLRSQISLLLITPKILIFRLKQKTKKKINAKVIYKKSVVFSYFLLRKRRFNEYGIHSFKKTFITYFTWNTKNCGGNKIIFEHVNRLIDRGYDVELLNVIGKQPRWFNLKTKVKPVFGFGFLKKRDILVATFWPTVWISTILRARKKFYFVLGWDENVHKNLLLRYLAKFSLKLNFNKIVISNYLKTKIKNYLNQKIKIDVIKTCGINTNIFKPGIKKITKKKEVRIISVISRYKYYKGADLLVKAIQKVKVSYPEYKFSLVSLEKNSYSRSIDYFFSNISSRKLAELYRSSDIFLATSRTEGFFIPGLEAMACGCPVITTDNKGMRDYTVNNQNSIIVKNLSDIWKKDSIGFLLKNQKLKRKIIENGFKTVQEYSWKHILDDLEKIFVAQ